MNCKNCNAKIEPGAKFCGKCGAAVPQEAEEMQTTDKQGFTVDKVVSQVKNFVGTLDAKQKKVMGVAVAVLVVLVVVVAWTGRKTTIDLTEYVDVEFEGENGDGEARIEWKERKLYKDAIKGLGMSKKDCEKIWDAAKELDTDEIEEIFDKHDMDEGDFSELFMDLIANTKLDEDEDLKNGDKVVLEFEYDNKEAAKFGLKFKGKKEKFKVKGLD